MTKLISNYARVTGLRIDPKGPNVKEMFCPLPFERYITIQTGTSAQAAKNYELWQEVLRLIHPMLEANHIAIVHLGLKDDPALAGVYDMRGKTTEFQGNYLVRRSLLHIGNDSFFIHCAGWNRRPLVALYGTTSVSAHGPYWYDPDKISLIESHRWGGVPTYVLQEPAKTVNLIDPYHVANEALRLLDISHVYPQQSRFWGALYQHTLLDLIPNTCPAQGFLPQLIINVRMDYLHNEAILEQVLRTGRRVNIITSKPISLNLIATFKGQILSYNHELGAAESELPSVEYIASVKGHIRQTVFFTRETDSAKLAAIRFPYFPDICMVEQIKDTTKEDYLGAALAYLNRPDSAQNRLDLEKELTYTRFRTNKFTLSNDRVFLSLAHYRAGLAIGNLGENTGQVIDDPTFWRDLNHCTLFYDPSSQPSL